MNAAVRKTFRLLSRHPGVLAGSCAAALLIGGIAWLHQQASRDALARQPEVTRQFEAAPQDWLQQERTLSDLRQRLAAGELAAVGLASAEPGLVLYTLKNGDKAHARLPGCGGGSGWGGAPACAGTLLGTLADRSADDGFALVSLHIDPRTASRRALDTAEALLSPLLLAGLLLLGLFAVVRLQGRSSGGGASRLAQRPDIEFAEVIGSDEAKAALTRVKAFMADPSRYARLGARPPRGVLLVGPPGTGKTLLAKALAGESQAHFIAVDGSYFTSMFYGAGVNKVKELFKLARRHAPCVLFIDEIDGLGRRTHSGSGAGGGAESESNRIINRVLVEMDGFEALDNVVVVGATNHEDNLDEAMRRPGRFDMLVRLTLPTLPDRERLYALYIDKLVHDGQADCAALARMSAGMSPADIANTVNKAASSAAEAGAEHVTADHLMRAIETQQLGGEVSSVKSLLTEATRQRLAFHEAGHALVGHWLDVGAVERVTIEPRGPALGVTYINRESEDPLFHMAELTHRLAMMLGGREAELMMLGSVSTGASDDLKRASELAVKMVGSMGFSEAFGLLSVSGVPKELVGPDVQAAVLKEARLLLDQAQAACRQLLATRRAQLQALAEALLDHEVLAGETLARLLAGPVVHDLPAHGPPPHSVADDLLVAC